MMPARRSQNWLPGIFNDFFGNEWVEKANTASPAINIIESDNDYKVEVAAPGMTKDDFNVNIDKDGNLHIHMEAHTEKKEEDKKSHYLRREFAYSKFEQTLLLPDDVEKEAIAARVNDGVLTVTLPKMAKPECPAARQIEVK